MDQQAPSDFAEVEGGAKDYSRRQSVEAAGFAVFVAGRRVPARHLCLCLAAALAGLCLLVVALTAEQQGDGAEPADGPEESTICGRSLADWGLAGSYDFSGGALPPGASLHGGAYVDAAFGVTLDGQSDDVCLGPASAEGWADDGSFTVSFMFTKAHCRIPGDFEFLFQALGECQGRRVTNSGQTGPMCNERSPQISVMLGCDNDDVDPSSTVSTSDQGHTLLRVLMVDDEQRRATFDVDLDLTQSPGTTGASSSAWAHVALAVTRTSMLVYVDGQPVSANDLGYAMGTEDQYGGRSWLWATRPENLALGDPRSFTRGGLGKLSLRGSACLGRTSWGKNRDNAARFGSRFAGSFAGVQLLNTALRGEDAECLYRSASIHAGLCPSFRGIFNGVGSGRSGDTASGMAGEEAGLAYAQRPHLMSTEDIADTRQSARDFDGPSEILTPAQAQPETAIAACAEICRRGCSRGVDPCYPFMGLQFNNQCFCGRIFGLKGQVDDSECDMDGDGEVDCGFGLAQNADTHACEWRNAAYAIHATPRSEGDAFDTEGDGATYLGCYIDSEGQYGDAMTLGGDAFADDGWGITFDGDGDFAVITDMAAGNYADSGEFTVAFYFTRVGDCTEAPGYERYEALYAHKGSGGLWQKWTRAAVSSALPLHHQDLIEIHLSCPTDDQPTLIRAFLGDHENRIAVVDVPASDARDDGFVTGIWVHIALAVQHSRISVVLDGRAVPDGDYIAAQQHGHDQSNLAWPDAPSLSAPLGTFLLSGGSDGPVLGAMAADGCAADWNCRSGRSSDIKPFAGSITFVTLWSRPLSQPEVECLFFWQNQQVEVCKEPSKLGGVQLNADLLDRDAPAIVGPHHSAQSSQQDVLMHTSHRSDLPNQLILGGDAYIDPGFGVTLDGNEDFLAWTPPRTSTWTVDASNSDVFSICSLSVSLTLERSIFLHFQASRSRSGLLEHSARSLDRTSISIRTSRVGPTVKMAPPSTS